METSRGYFGFKSFSDFCHTIINGDFAVVKWTLAFIAGAGGFITEYIYDDERAVWTLIALFGVDLVTGVWKAIKSNTFSSFKLGRFVPAFTFSFLFLALTWNVSRSSIYFLPLPGILYAIMAGQLIASIFENATEIGLIPPGFIGQMKQHFSITNIKKRIK